MGLDTNIGVNNDEIIFSDEYFNEDNGYYEKHSLSRKFCNLMIRKHIVEHKAELDQIGEITNTEISTLY